MSKDQPREGLSRRSVLRIIAGSAGAQLGTPLLKGKSACSAHNSGGTQAAANSAPYAARFFDAEQMAIIDSLSEIIIPADGHSPGAHEARVCDFIDAILVRSDKEEKKLWLDGLAALDALSKSTHGKSFGDCTQEQHLALVERIGAHEEHPETVEDRFFVALKRATVDGYYTSEIGIHKELEYQGNDYLADFPGCEHEEHKR